VPSDGRCVGILSTEEGVYLLREKDMGYHSVLTSTFDRYGKSTFFVDFAGDSLSETSGLLLWVSPMQPSYFTGTVA